MSSPPIGFNMERTLHYTNEIPYNLDGKIISTIVIEQSGEVVYQILENGKYSYCHGIGNLFEYLNGDTDARLISLDNPKDFEGICRLFTV